MNTIKVSENLIKGIERGRIQADINEVKQALFGNFYNAGLRAELEARHEKLKQELEMFDILHGLK